MFVSAQITPIDQKISEDLESIHANEREIIDGAAQLPSNYRKHLTYLYARLNKPAVAEPLAAYVLAEDPKDIRILRAMASMNLALKKSEKTMFYARKILALEPENREGLFFMATAEQTANNPDVARVILYEMKKDHENVAKAPNEDIVELPSTQLKKKPEPYPFELDLAASANQAGDWHLAMNSYITILRDYTLTPELRQQVRQALDSIYRQHLPKSGFTFTQNESDTGIVREFEGDYSQPINQRTRIELKGGVTDTNIASSAELMSASHSSEHFNFLITHKLSNRYSVEAHGGKFAQDPQAGLKIIRHLLRGGNFAFSYTWGQPNVDSLAMRFLDARENRINLHADLRLHRRINFLGNAYQRTLLVSNEPIGHGYGADWAFIYPERLYAMDFYFSVRGGWSETDANEERVHLIAGLPFRSDVAINNATVTNYTNSHIHHEGLGLLVVYNFNEKLIFDTNAGVDYYLMRDELAWNAGAGFLYRPIKSIDIRGDFLYSTVNTSGTEVTDNIQFTLGIRKHF